MDGLESAEGRRGIGDAPGREVPLSALPDAEVSLGLLKVFRWMKYCLTCSEKLHQATCRVRHPLAARRGRLLISCGISPDPPQEAREQLWLAPATTTFAASQPSPLCPLHLAPWPANEGAERRAVLFQQRDELTYVCISRPQTWIQADIPSPPL